MGNSFSLKIFKPWHKKFAWEIHDDLIQQKKGHLQHMLLSFKKVIGCNVKVLIEYETKGIFGAYFWTDLKDGWCLKMKRHEENNIKCHDVNIKIWSNIEVSTWILKPCRCWISIWEDLKMLWVHSLIQI